MKRGHPWSMWRRGGSVATAAIAVAALAATVITSSRALADASEIVIRGEGDLLLGTLVSDLNSEESGPISQAALERELEAHTADGLRYVAIVNREGGVIAEAGHAGLPSGPLRPGEAQVQGRRARITGLLVPPRRGARTPGPRPPGAALLVAELEPPVIETLRHGLERIAVVATIAGAVLLAFAIAWSRSARRLAVFEERAAREQRLVALGAMSSVMAHELRNPLASLKGHAQLLAEDLDAPDDTKRRAKAERIVSEAERLEALTTTLLDFVRDGPIERVRMIPRDLVARSLEDLPDERVVVDLASAPPTFEGDPARLARALHNLIDNALQAAPDGTVELRIATEDEGVVLTVSDHGPGLPAGSEAQIFEPFMTTRVRGTGLGLAVARRIAEQHDGTLTGENQPSGGALFTLRLPEHQGA